jgi:hypothetical protein
MRASDERTSFSNAKHVEDLKEENLTWPRGTIGTPIWA